MIAAYEHLHALGYAHSVEAWRDGSLAGGLYGVALGRAFFGESMFHRVSEASRAALAGLVALLRLRGAELLDCQQQTPHIMRMGGVMLAADGAEEPGGRRPESIPWAPWKKGYVYSVVSGSWMARS